MAETFEFVPWGEIELFHNLVKTIEYWKTRPAAGATIEDDFLGLQISTIQKPIVFRGKVKLHGSNAGVALQGSEVKAQSRNQFIGTSGFGRIVFENESYFKSLGVGATDNNRKVTIFGEYCGRKVQKGVALEKLKNDIFAIFAIDFDGDLVIDPEDIDNFMTKDKTIQKPSNVFVIPWHTEEIPMDLNSVQSGGCAEALAKIEIMVEQVDKVDPWVEATFGITGPGEGLVLFPVSLTEKSGKFKTLKKEVFSKFAFKAKGEQHRVVVTKTSVQVNPSVAANVKAYVDLMCPEARLRQGAGEVGGFDVKKVKAFIDWVTKDVEKEGKAELEVSGLDWNLVKKEITKTASQWYSKKAKEAT